MAMILYVDRPKVFTFKCEHCNAAWYANEKEINYTPPSMEYAVYMNCPHCGEKTYAE
jgi:hypothetical protein